MAQALMKRAIGDIPIVTHIQKESNGMNKLYSQSMCSVKQWRAYQAAEAMVSAEVDEVRAEADEIEPGWSQVRIRIERSRRESRLPRPRGLFHVSMVDLYLTRRVCSYFVVGRLGHLETSNAISQHAETKA
jgi:Preprotein translocase subunit Sec66